MARKKTRSIIAQVLIISLLILISLIPAQFVANGQAPTRTPRVTPTVLAPGKATSNWSQPYAFERTGWFPDLTTDTSGRLYLAYSSSVVNITKGANSVREGYDIVLFSSSPNGDTWDPINEVAAVQQSVVNNSAVTRPALRVDQLGLLHLTFEVNYLYYTQVPVQQTASARNWKPEVNLTGNDLAYYSRMVTDSKGRLHLFYTQVTATNDCTNCYHLFYKFSEDNGKKWSDEQDISVIPTGSVKPQILVDDQDNLHVVWEAGRGGGLGQVIDPTSVFYTVSYNRGQTWAQPVEFSTETAQSSKNITIGRDGKGNIVVAWLSLPDDQVFYQVSSDHGLSWTKPERLGEVWGTYKIYQSRLDTYTMATDSSGNLHLVLVGRMSEAEQRMSLLHYTWDGTAWSKPEVIVSYQGDAPEWPQLVISNGNQLNLAWFVRPKDFIWIADSSIYKVWYSHSMTNTPFVYPTTWPTLPPPTSEPPTPAPTLPYFTQMPTIPAINATLDPRAVGDNAFTESGQLSTIAMSAVPALALVVVLVIVILIKKR